MLNKELKLPQRGLLTDVSPSLMEDDITDEMQRNASDMVYINLTTASAMLTVIKGDEHYGTINNGFAALDDESQSHYLWALSELIEDACRAREIEVAGRIRGRGE